VVDACRFGGYLDLLVVRSRLREAQVLPHRRMKRYVSCETTPTSSESAERLRARRSTPSMVILPRLTS